jgi:hypothetical protein
MSEKSLAYMSVVLETYRRFMKHPGRVKSKFSFWEWFNLFNQFSNTFHDIALKVRANPSGKTDCTVETIRRLYVKYFAHLLPCSPSGRFRRKLYNLNKRLFKARDFSKAPALLKKVAKMAMKRGFAVEKNPISSRARGFSSRLILINGKKCGIHRVSGLWRSPRGKREYSSVKVSSSRLQECDFLIILRETKKYSLKVFVIPVSVLLQLPERRKRFFYLYIPLKKYPVYLNHRPKLDVWNYLNAWHLLSDH